MYLVLTAMLALNVQREVLDAFVVLNEGSERSLETYAASNDALFGQIKFAMGVDPEKVKPYHDRAEHIRTATADMVHWMDDLSSELMQFEEGLSPEEADTVQLRFVEKLDLYDESTRILIGPKEDASEGSARELRNKLEEYVAAVNRELAPVDLPALDSPFEFAERKVDGESKAWEVFTFYDTPLAACIAILNKMATDVRAFEYNALSGLRGRIDVDDIPVDTVLARVIPASSYVTLGEAYKADIFLGAYSTTSEPEVLIGEVDANGFLIGEGDPLTVDGGVGQFTMTPQREGLHTYTGEVRIKDKQGQVRRYPFAQEFLAAKPSAVVSPSAMNVMYIGPDNPIDVSIPGIPEEKVKVTISGGNQIRKVGTGKYICKLVRGTPRNITVNVSAEVSGGEVKSFGSLPFRVLPLPRPYVRIADIQTTGKLNYAELKYFGQIKAEYEQNFPLKLDPPKVIRFKVFHMTRQGQPRERAFEGKNFDDKLKAFIESVPRGDAIQFREIMVQGIDGPVWEANNLTIEIK